MYRTGWKKQYHQGVSIDKITRNTEGLQDDAIKAMAGNIRNGKPDKDREYVRLEEHPDGSLTVMSGELTLAALVLNGVKKIVCDVYIY